MQLLTATFSHVVLVKVLRLFKLVPTSSLLHLLQRVLNDAASSIVFLLIHVAESATRMPRRHRTLSLMDLLSSFRHDLALLLRGRHRLLFVGRERHHARAGGRLGRAQEVVGMLTDHTRLALDAVG